MACHGLCHSIPEVADAVLVGAFSQITDIDPLKRSEAADREPTVETAIGFHPPQARPVIAAVRQTALATGAPWDPEMPFVTARVGR